MLSNKQIKRNLFILLMAVAIALFGLSAAAAAQEVNDVNTADEPQMLGMVEGTGTYFEVTDSDYLNITLESSEPIVLRLESIPEMIIMDINLAGLEASTQLTLGGFEPSTTYYKYEDNYHNLAEFTTDDNGSYTYKQDLTKRHLVFIQSRPSTIFIPSDANVGTWDPNTRIYTLIKDVNETIQIDQNDLTLDGAGHTLSGPGSGPTAASGVYLRDRTGVTVQNLTVQACGRGIYLAYSSNNTLIGNTASNDYQGIYIFRSSSNILTNNTVSNDGGGISIFQSPDNTLISNTAGGVGLQYSGGTTMTGNLISDFSIGGNEDSHYENNIDTTNTVNGKPIWYVKEADGNAYDSSTNAGIFYAIDCCNITIKNLMLTNVSTGVFLRKTHYSTIQDVNVSNCSTGIYLRDSNNNILTNNGASNCLRGIWLFDCNHITLTDNNTPNNHTGIDLNNSHNSTLINNTASNNSHYGIYTYYSCHCTLIFNSTLNNGKAGVCLSQGRLTSHILTANTANSNGYGIIVGGSTDSTLTGNTASNNGEDGIRLAAVRYSMLTGNTTLNNNNGIRVGGHYNVVMANIISNNNCGVHLARRQASTNNIIRANTISDNNRGIYLFGSPVEPNGNEIYNNNFTNNIIQAYVEDGNGNHVFNLAKPIGGNYWSDWTGPDADLDGFVDFPYVFTGGQDNLPLTAWGSVDSDGVVDAVENGAPNGGDGNDDGILDSEQDNVASLPCSVNGEYVTLASPEGTPLSDVNAVLNPAPPNDPPPPGVEFPIGSFEFTVEVNSPGDSAVVTLFLPPGQTVNTYYKYGPTPGNPTNHWYEFLWDGTTGAEILADRIILHFVDGQRGDDDLLANAQIVEPGAPVYEFMTIQEKMDLILDFFDAAIDSGTLKGRGNRECIARLRMQVFEHMLNVASELIEREWYELACLQVRRIYRRCDGQPWLPDLIEGEAVSELASMIQNLAVSMCCE